MKIHTLKVIHICFFFCLLACDKTVNGKNSTRVENIEILESNESCIEKAQNPNLLAKNHFSSWKIIINDDREL